MLFTTSLFPMISNEELSKPPSPATSERSETTLSSISTLKSPTTVPTAWFSFIVNFDKVKTVGKVTG